jgi:hypothetical protein
MIFFKKRGVQTLSGDQQDTNPQPVPNLVADPKAKPGGKEIVIDEDIQAQADPSGKNKGVEVDPSAWLGKQGEGSSGVRQESGSSANRAQRVFLEGKILQLADQVNPIALIVDLLAI